MSIALFLDQTYSNSDAIVHLNQLAALFTVVIPYGELIGWTILLNAIICSGVTQRWGIFSFLNLGGISIQRPANEDNLPPSAVLPAVWTAGACSMVTQALTPSLTQMLSPPSPPLVVLPQTVWVAGARSLCLTTWHNLRTNPDSSCPQRCFQQLWLAQVAGAQALATVPSAAVWNKVPLL